LRDLNKPRSAANFQLKSVRKPSCVLIRASGATIFAVPGAAQARRTKHIRPLLVPTLPRPDDDHSADARLAFSSLSAIAS
jgi:hypothetical protein